jgi:hypothetical protein
MFNWLKKNIIPDILDIVDRFLTSYGSCITTQTNKMEYKIEPWDGENTSGREASLC